MHVCACGCMFLRQQQQWRRLRQQQEVYDEPHLLAGGVGAT